MRPSAPADEGFTLIDTLIAMVIMGTTVVVLVGALAGLISASQYHRGHAVTESATRNVSQALVARTSARTTLTAALGATSGTATLNVADTSQFGTSGFLSVELEIMRITGRTSTTLTVVRGAGRAYDTWPSGDTTSAVAHSSGAPVAPALMCASVGEITPDSSQYVVPTGVTVTVTAIEYWDPVGAAFLSTRDACITKYKERCKYDDGTDDLRVDCDAGLQRVTLSTSTSGDTRFKGVTGSTQFLVRKGSGS